MALTDDQRVACLREIMAADPGPFNLSRADAKAAIDAIDAWATSNASSFNQAIPQPARSALSSQQKALALAFVCLRRAGK